MSTSNDKGVFNKLIVIQAGSIVEAALHEIIYRAQNFTREGVPNISKQDRDELATKTVELFNNIIVVMKKYDILNAPSRPRERPGAGNLRSRSAY